MRLRPILVLAAACAIAATAASASDEGLHGVHAAAGLECAACHTDEGPPEAAPDHEVCVACHGTMLPAADAPAPDGPDPHASPHLMAGETPVCTECHRIHEPSVVTCTMCHRGFEFDIK